MQHRTHVRRRVLRLCRQCRSGSRRLSSVLRRLPPPMHCAVPSTAVLLPQSSYAFCTKRARTAPQLSCESHSIRARAGDCHLAEMRWAPECAAHSAGCCINSPVQEHNTAPAATRSS